MLQKCFKSMLIVLFCFCIFTIPVFAQTTIYDMAKTWAEAWQMRNGQQRYDMMSDAMKQKFKKEQGDNNMSIGWSSPWVESYTIKTENTNAEICYIMTDSTGEYYIKWDYIDFQKQNNEWKIIAYTQSELYNYDKSSQSIKDITCVYEYYNLEKDIFNEYHCNLFANAVKQMLLTQYPKKSISNIAFYQTGKDNTGKIETIYMDITVDVSDIPQNPAKQQSLQVLKKQNMQNYIKEFENYIQPKQQKYTIEAKIDLETECIFFISIQSKS